jgi:hypothetical protein
LESNDDLKTPDQVINRYSGLRPDAGNLGGGWVDFHGWRVNNGQVFWNWVMENINASKSVIVIITGSPGSGKTYEALRNGEIIDPKFQVLENPTGGSSRSQIVFKREHLEYLIGPSTPLERKQVIIIDEAQLILGNRTWFLEVQRELLQKVETMRSLGFIVIIVCLSISLLDSIIRKFVLCGMIHMEDRGRGIFYTLSTNRFSGELRPKRRSVVYTKLPGWEDCKHPDCLNGCPYLNNTDPSKKCNNIRAIYERNKRCLQNEMSAKKETAKKLRKSGGIVPKMMIEVDDQSPSIPVDDNIDKLFTHQDTIEVDPNTGVINRLSVEKLLWSNYHVKLRSSDLTKVISGYRKLVRKS